jgi:anti-anti-sigma factor
MGFNVTLNRDGRTALITLEGELDTLHAEDFRDQVEQAAIGDDLEQLVLDMTNLSYISSAGMRGLVFARQKMGDGVRIVLVRTSPSVEQTIRLVGFHQSVDFSDEVPGQVPS